MKDRSLLLPALIIAAQYLFFTLFFPPILEPDSAGYIELGRSLAAGLGFDSIVRLPGYPAFLAACYALFGGSQVPVIALQHALGLAVFISALALLPGRRSRYIFTALFFFDFLYASYQHALLAETLLSFLVCMSALAFRAWRRSGSPWYLLACGALLAAGTFTKPVLKLFPAFALLLVLAERRPPLKKAAGAAALLLVPLLAAGLWSWRNHARHGSFALLPFESMHYVGKIVMHPEFPEGSVSREIFQRRVGEAPGGLKQKIKSGVIFRVIDDLRAEKGLSDGEINAEFKQVYKLSVLRHPFLTAKETLTEVFYFFFSAHNLFAKHALEGRLPYSVSEALAKRDFAGLAFKVAVSMHPFYWAVFLLTAWFAFSRRRELMMHGDGFAAYGLLFLFYLASVTSLANEGLANYRCPAHPFMLFCSALALAAWFPGRAPDAGKGRE